MTKINFSLNKNIDPQFRGGSAVVVPIRSKSFLSSDVYCNDNGDGQMKVFVLRMGLLTPHHFIE